MKKYLARHKELLQQIQKLGVMIPGTVRTVYQFCGKPNCSCASGQVKDKHGPYIYWDRKVKGSFSSLSITPQLKQILLKGIQNRRNFEKIKKQLIVLGELIATKTKN